MTTLTRQHRRATERRADKPEPEAISRTSLKWLGRTKGEPFSRMKLTSITPAQIGVPAVFNIRGYTTNKVHKIKATLANIDWFVKGLPDPMKRQMAGMF